MRSTLVRILCCFALAVLGLGCYAHGWPFDDKHMCPGGPAFPIDDEECARRNPVPKPVASELQPDAGADAGAVSGAR